jgi:hypothetical protein
MSLAHPHAKAKAPSVRLVPSDPDNPIPDNPILTLKTPKISMTNPNVSSSMIPLRCTSSFETYRPRSVPLERNASATDAKLADP